MGEVIDKDRIMMRTSWVSTIGNSVLAISKIVVGLVAGSLAVLGDGIDSATDVAISIVMIITARIMRRPPSKQYPYGYAKAESIATKILSFVLLYAGIQMFISSISALLSGEDRELPGMMTIAVTVFSIIAKLALALYQYKQGKKINSSLLQANAKNMSMDVVMSAGVLVGLFFTFVLKMPVFDTITGFVVSILIIRSGIQIFLDSNAELMDGVKDVSVYQKIFEAVEKVPGASNPHRVRSRLAGNMYIIALDIEADGDISLNDAHHIAHGVEESIKESVENVYDIIVHIEPKGICHAEEKFGLDPKMFD